MGNPDGLGLDNLNVRVEIAPLFREGLIARLESLPGVAVVPEGPAVVFIGGQGWEARAGALRAEGPGRDLVLVADGSEADFIGAWRLGIAVFAGQDGRPKDLLAAARAAAAGELYCAPSLRDLRRVAKRRYGSR